MIQTNNLVITISLHLESIIHDLDLQHMSCNAEVYFKLMRYCYGGKDIEPFAKDII